MKKNQKKHKFLILMLAVTLVFSLFPVSVSAAETNYAQDAVVTLNGVYGYGTFTASNEPYTVDMAVYFYNNILNYTGENINSVLKDNIISSEKQYGDAITHAEASLLIAAILRVSGETFYLNGTLNPYESISQADFAIMLYRALRSTIGFHNFDNFKPGEYGYFAACYANIHNITIENSWDTDALYEAVETDLISKGFDKNQLFYDVSSNDWYYDGIMYLYLNSIAKGDISGFFGVDDTLTYGELTAFLYKNNYNSEADTEVMIAWSVYNGYVSSDINANDNVKRKDLISAIFKMYGKYSADNVNLAVLECFIDKSSIGDDYKAAFAYFVSAGVLTGTSGNLEPESYATRAEYGIFLARILQGLDTSKMRDYEIAVGTVLGG